MSIVSIEAVRVTRAPVTGTPYCETATTTRFEVSARFGATRIVTAYPPRWRTRRTAPGPTSTEAAGRAVVAATGTAAPTVIVPTEPLPHPERAAGAPTSRAPAMTLRLR